MSLKTSPVHVLLFGALVGVNFLVPAPQGIRPAFYGAACCAFIMSFYDATLGSKMPTNRVALAFQIKLLIKIFAFRYSFLIAVLYAMFAMALAIETQSPVPVLFDGASAIVFFGLSQFIARRFFFNAGILPLFLGRQAKLHASASTLARRSQNAKADTRPESAALQTGTPVAIADPARLAAATKIVELLLAPHLQAAGRAHAETILTEVGALAGYAAQMAAWAGLADPEKWKAGKFPVVFTTKNGETYYFGDALNDILLMSKPGKSSIWSFVAGAVPNPEPKTLPDVLEIVEHAAKSIGNTNFGVPRLPAEHMPHKLPRIALNENWNRISKAMTEAGRTLEELPLDLAVAAQKLIVMGKDILSPTIAAKIVMEAAIPMSKIDPRTMPKA